MAMEGTPVSEGGAVVREAPGLLVIGAGVIVANWVILGILAGEWNPGALYIALSLLVLASAFGIAGIALGKGTQRAIGLFMGLAALVIVIADLRFNAFPEDALRIIAYVVFIGGCVLMFIGARQLAD